MAIKTSTGVPDTIIQDQHSGFDIRTNYRVTSMFLNNSDYDITVVNQSNLAIPVAANSHPTVTNKAFIIRHIYQFISNEAVIAVINNINAVRTRYNQLPPEMKIIHDVLLKNFDTMQQVQNVNISIDRCINVNAILKHKHYYIDEENLLLHFGSFDPAFPHPRSAVGRTINDYMDTLGDRTVSGLFVEIVDNTKTLHTRYMWAAKHLIEIPVLEDSTRENGVYFTNIENSPLAGTTLNPIHYNFKDAEEELGIYPTKEQAQTNGDPDRLSSAHVKTLERELHEAKLAQKKAEDLFKHQDFQRTSELKKTEAELKQIDLESQKILNEQTSIIEEMKFENSKLKERLEKAKAKSDRNKSKRDDKSNKKSHKYNNRKLESADYYEQRSYDRKDNTEALKTGALILTTGISIFALMGKFNKG